QRTAVYARYALTGAVATAAGALAGGLLTRVFEDGAGPTLASYRSVVILYGVLGTALAVLFSRLSPLAEPAAASDRDEVTDSGFAALGRTGSRRVVLNLSALFALDAFGGGFVAQSFAAYWFHLRFGIEPAVLGPIFFSANVLAGSSALLASRIAARV